MSKPTIKERRNDWGVYLDGKLIGTAKSESSAELYRRTLDEILGGLVEEARDDGFTSGYDDGYANGMCEGAENI
jgi:hypothetical protein